MSEVCTYGDFGFTYGDGHYGLCQLRNARGCAPAGPNSNPTTTTEPFDIGCDTCPPQVPDASGPDDRIVIMNCPDEGDC